VARFEHGLSRDPLDHGALDRVVRLGRAELVRQLLNELDRFLLLSANNPDPRRSVSHLLQLLGKERGSLKVH
jgi:hypothetical protein